MPHALRLLQTLYRLSRGDGALRNSPYGKETALKLVSYEAVRIPILLLQEKSFLTAYIKTFWSGCGLLIEQILRREVIWDTCLHFTESLQLGKPGENIASGLHNIFLRTYAGAVQTGLGKMSAKLQKYHTIPSWEAVAPALFLPCLGGTVILIENLLLF